ncbi:MAG: nucleotidyltransferase family protein [Negativicutes bacterium]|nr:nucleotidyltransferase family protein [Negativicutes bacterium]
MPDRLSGRMAMKAVVLAGDSRGGGECRPLWPVGGRPLVDRVLQAVTAAPSVESVAVVASPAVAGYLGRIGWGGRVAAAGPDLPASLQQALAVGGGGGRMLLAAADLPFVTPGVVERFVGVCTGREGDFFYPVVGRDCYERQFAGLRRTYVRLREGEFTGGNLFVVDSGALRRGLPRVEKLLAWRKSPWRLAGLLGWGILWRLVCRRLTIDRVTARFSQVMSVDARVIVSDDPAVAADIDGREDLPVAEAIAGRRPAG